MAHDLFHFLLWVVSGAILAYVGAMITRWLQFVPRVVCYIGHSAQFPVPLPEQSKSDVQPNLQIATYSLVLRNTGKKPATNLKVLHSVLPQQFMVYGAHTEYTQELLSNGIQAITFPRLLPNEQITISYLHIGETATQTEEIMRKSIPTIKHDDAMAQAVQAFPMKVYPKSLTYVLWVLIVLGALTTLYWGYKLTLLILNYLGCSA